MLPPLLDDCSACSQIMLLHRARSHQGILDVLVQVHYPCVTHGFMLSGIFGTLLFAASPERMVAEADAAQLARLEEEFSDLRFRFTALQGEVTDLRCEVDRLRGQLYPLTASERRTARRLQPRLSDPSPAFELLAERTLHNEGCFDFLIRALQRNFPAIQWQSLIED